MRLHLEHETDYCLAPLVLRARWWLAGWIWRWGQMTIDLGAESPDLQSPLWRR